MNRRLNRLNRLMRESGHFFDLVDPVGLSDDDNRRAWDTIIQKDKDKKFMIDEIIRSWIDIKRVEYTHEVVPIEESK